MPDPTPLAPTAAQSPPSIPPGAKAPKPPKLNVAPWWWPTMRDVLAILSTALMAVSFGTLAASAFLGMKVDPLVTQALGQYSGAIILQWGGVMGFYYGTTKSALAAAAVAPPPVPRASSPTEG